MMTDMRRFLAVALLVCCYAGAAAVACMDQELNALKQLYIATGGANWARHNGWVTGDRNCCAWDGITCNEASKVVGLNLVSNNLVGKLDAVPFSQLQSLSVLRLLDNGQVPPYREKSSVPPFVDFGFIHSA